nr:MAG TPA: hypothetical protein [Caudoviricetes sp.]
MRLSEIWYNKLNENTSLTDTPLNIFISYLVFRPSHFAETG